MKSSQLEGFPYDKKIPINFLAYFTGYGSYLWATD